MTTQFAQEDSGEAEVVLCCRQNLLPSILPPLDVERVRELARAAQKDVPSLMKFNKGTTTLGFRYKGGAMIACDSRASQGSLIASQTVRKIIEINKHMLGTMSGGAADCVYWERFLAKLCRMHELRNGQRISVAHASKLLANIFWEYRGRGLSCGIMLSGYEIASREAALYYLSDDGTRIKGDVFSLGSGSPYAYGVLDTYYKWDLSDEEALDLAKRSIFHAGHRDGASGGVVRVYHIHEQGWTKLVEAEDFFDLYSHYANDQPAPRQ